MLYAIFVEAREQASRARAEADELRMHAERLLKEREAYYYYYYYYHHHHHHY